MAKIEQKKLFEAFMGDVKPQIDTVMNAYKSEYKVESKQKGSLFESFDSSKPKIAIFEGARKKSSPPLISDAQLKEDFFNRAGSLISNLKYNQKDLVITAKSITEKYLTKNSNPIERLREVLNVIKQDDGLTKENHTGVVLLSAYLLGLLQGYDPRGAGFLFENFIAGIVGAQSNNGTENGFSDITVDNHKLSLKFVASSSAISNAFKKEDIDDKTFYIIAVKNGTTSIKFYVIHINQKTEKITLDKPIVKHDKNGIEIDNITHAIHYSDKKVNGGRITIINDDTTLTKLSTTSGFTPVTLDFRKIFYENIETIVDEAVQALHSAYQFIDNLETEVFSIDDSQSFMGDATHNVDKVKQAYIKTGNDAETAFKSKGW